MQIGQIKNHFETYFFEYRQINSLAFKFPLYYEPVMMMQRFMGVALTFVLLLGMCISTFHSHDHDEHDHVEQTSISSLELEAECSLCDQLGPNSFRLMGRVTPSLTPKVLHNTPLSSQCSEFSPKRTIATLMNAPKTSPPFGIERL